MTDHTCNQLPQLPALTGVTVLQVIPALVNGGAEQTCVEMADAIVQAGGRALVASSGGPMADAVAAVGGEPVTLPLKTKAPWRLLANASRLEALIRREGVDLVHARSRAPAWSALWASRRTRVPLVTTFHSPYNAKGPLKRWYNGVMAKGVQIIANSAYTAAHIAREYPAARPLIVTIPRPVDVNRFDPAAVTADRTQALSAAWGVPGGCRIILLPGRITRWKGQDLLVQALTQLPPDVVGVLAGSAKDGDAYAQELDALADSLGVRDRIFRVGHCSDLPAAFALSTVAVSCSRDPEGFGRVVAEALAMGVPVVAPDHGGAQEIVSPGQNGWLVTPDSLDALIQGLSQALAAPAEQRATMGAHGRRRILSMFTVPHLQAATLAVYRQVLGLS